MRYPSKPLYRRAARAFRALPWCAGFAALTLLLAACGPAEPAVRGSALSEQAAAAPVRYSIICFIHGDGDYMYHDSLGNERRADEDALAGAIRVAENNPMAEIFIFHETPSRNVLFLFPRHDGEFMYYRNGRLFASASYPRSGGLRRIDAPMKLYEEYRAPGRLGVKNVFLYFGHELSEIADDETEPEQPFSVPELAEGLKRITGDSTKLDLVVLSSCFNGTPYTVASLTPYARTIIASPDNLHLSYFDLRPLEHLESGMPDGNVQAFATRFARHAFDRLTHDIQTAVTVAVYDVDCVQGYLHSVDSVDRALTALRGERVASSAAVEHCDCADHPSYMLPLMSEGVDVFYRSARFGRSKVKQHHSGWQCWKELELQASRAGE